MSNFFIHFPSERIPHENKLLYEPIESPYAKRVKGIYSMYEKVSKAVAETIKNQFFPVVLSGDHSMAGATIAGIKMAKPKSKLGVIWIDAAKADTEAGERIWAHELVHSLQAERGSSIRDWHLGPLRFNWLSFAPGVPALLAGWPDHDRRLHEREADIYAGTQ